jgi:hypothetical protein
MGKVLVIALTLHQTTAREGLVRTWLGLAAILNLPWEESFLGEDPPF